SVTVAHPPSAHTYRLLLVKEPFPPPPSRFAVKSFCSSAAEKRDYEAFYCLRQAFISSCPRAFVANRFFLQGFSALQNCW
ncbi:MAG TPA: hypothetical protein VJ652_08245, partial [Noviherbaspirillum sp.]|nr:hypothetical protein [Noviherbaspirillum sp.]